MTNDGDPGDRVAGLRADSDSQSLGVVVNVSGEIGKWQTGLSANYSRNWSQSLLERDDGVPRTDRDRSRRQNLTARLTTGTTIIDLAAGPLRNERAVSRRDTDNGSIAIRSRTTSHRQDALDPG